MRLEERVAVWDDLGEFDFRESKKLLLEIVKKRQAGEILDAIFFCQHHPIIDFGNSAESNKFAPDLIEKFVSEEAIIEHLAHEGINFSRTHRGGGSTYIGPGQLMVYPIVDYERIVGRPLGVGDYKILIDKIMQEVLQSYGIDAKIFEVAAEIGEADSSSRKDRKDVWVQRNGKYYKLGGKGGAMTGGVTYYGFSFYVTNSSIEGFKYIQACGYSKDALDITSVEREVGHVIDLEDFKKRILGSVKEHFRYLTIRKGGLVSQHG